MLRKYSVRFLSFVYRLLFLHQMVVSVGDNSIINSWRIRPRRGGTIVIGSGSLVRTRVVLERGCAELHIGDRTFVGQGLLTIADRVVIGSDVLISWGVTIVDHNSHSINFSERKNDVRDNAFRGIKDWSVVSIKPVYISDKVWIGFGVSILKGVSIGVGSIVAANSVVTKDVPPWTIVAGNPAVIVRNLPVGDG